MSVVINLQPGTGTRVRFVHNEVEPPTLVIYDGTATLFFSPAPVSGALQDMHRFAQALTDAAGDWTSACGRAADAANRADPLLLGSQLSPSEHSAGTSSKENDHD